MAPPEPSLQSKDFMELIKWMEGTRQAQRREEMTGQREETTGDSKMMQDSAQLLSMRHGCGHQGPNSKTVSPLFSFLPLQFLLQDMDEGTMPEL